MIYVVIQEGGAYSTYWQSVVSVHTSEDDARLTVELAEAKLREEFSKSWSRHAHLERADTEEAAWQRDRGWGDVPTLSVVEAPFNPIPGSISP